MQAAFSSFQRSRWRLEDLKPIPRALVVLGLVAATTLLAGGVALSLSLWRLSATFPRAPFDQPSRLYGAVPRLVVGGEMSPEAVVADLEMAGYREVAGGPLLAGTYCRAGDRVAVQLRRYFGPGGPAGRVRVEAAFDGHGVAGLQVAGRPAKSADLEPPLLATFYDDDLEERRPVALGELPDSTVKAVLAAEDDEFFVHPGVSPLSIARALWADLRGSQLQGGSTITQQLVKNLYLSNRRTLKRKVKEAMIAEMVELRYGKRTILEAYLNEIYLGSSGPANLIGFGAASRAYFGKDAAELDLDEAATLAGMIQAPGDYSPVEHPIQAVERRNRVLKRMADLGWISPSRLQQAAAQPLRVDPERIEARRIAPYFTEAARAEAEARFGVGKLDGKGYRLFSTLRWQDQQQAEASVSRGLAGLEKGWERRSRTKDTLQAALISVDPRDGSILAWVGGRDYAESQFDRVGQARRQAGSAFKPVIYAAAFEDGTVGPTTLLNDSPISVRIGTASWQPQNYDQTFHGWVTARSALEQSYNIPTVRVALQVGLRRMIRLAHEMGISEDLEPRPSLALGAFETSPLDLAEVYATFAAGGMRPTLHGLAAVLDSEGRVLPGDELPAPRRALSPQSAYLVTSALQGVVDHGTGATARVAGLDGEVAGKTGTTNDRRDSWFAGYSPDRVTVVWVGYDDNSATHLSGARAALPIWNQFTAAMRPTSGYPVFAVPEGMVTATIDPSTGLLATPLCPQRVTEILPEWLVPLESCIHPEPGLVQETRADLAPGVSGAGAAEPAEIAPSDQEPTVTEESRYPILGGDGAPSLDSGGKGTIEMRRRHRPLPPIQPLLPMPSPEPSPGAPSTGRSSPG